MPYTDYFLTGVSSISTMTTNSILGPITDQLTANPQIAKPVSFGAGTIRYQAAIMIHGLCMRYRVVGAQANILASGDLFNSSRQIIWESGASYQDTTLAIGTGLDNWYDNSDIVRIHHDHVANLPSQAYNTSSGFNVPNVVVVEKYLPINRRYDWFSTNNPPTVWDTKKGDILLNFISDSGVVPHPTIWVSIRIYYDFIQ